MKRIPILVFALSAGLSLLAQAQATPKPPWGIGLQSVTAIDVPSDIRRVVGSALEYDDAEPIKGVTADFDGDGVRDFLVQSAQSLCGSVLTAIQLSAPSAT